MILLRQIISIASNEREIIFNYLLHLQYLFTFQNKYHLVNVISVHNILYHTALVCMRGINFHSIVRNEISWAYATRSGKMEKPSCSTWANNRHRSHRVTIEHEKKQKNRSRCS